MEKKLGRPRKPEGQKYIGKLVKLEPELWRELEETVPRGERGEVIRAGLRRELARLKRKRLEG